jgi:hypothetical protein
MNGELPPIDPGIREQLARRSAGRQPEGLLADVSAAVDAVSLERPTRLRFGFAAMGGPRLAAAASLALVVVIAAAVVVVPRFMTSPAGSTTYPVDRALTTDELGRLLAGPQLAVNTALVASVTIDPRPDACPMNSRPTYGVVHGIEPQICVVGPIGDTGPVATGPNVFAFRYLGPGILGLLGLITPASPSKLTFAVADDWSKGGKTFLVEGWLGADPFSCPTYVPTDGGDPLNPDGSDRCEINWMSDEDPNTTPSPDASGVPPLPKRLVDAAGMRLIDDIPSYPPVHGVYVVGIAAARQCVASTMSSPGCGLVLAKVADVTIPKASPLPTPPPATPTSPSGSYPEGRPLTTAELGRALATGIPTDQVMVVQASFAQATGCATVKGYAPIGTLAGVSPNVCVVGIADGKAVHSPAATSGVFAFRVLDQHTLGFMAAIDGAGAGGFTYQGNESWPAGKTILVSGWLAAGSSIYFCGNMGAVIPELLDPGGVECGDYWISDQHPQPAGPVYSPQPVPTGFQRVSLPDYPDVGGGLLPYDSRATYLVRDEARCDAGASPTDQAVNTTWDKLCGWQIMARVDPLTVPTGPTPTAAPPMTSNAPAATPLLPPGGSPIGLFGDGNRPLTEAELASLWASDPAHLAGRIVIAKGPVPTGFQCRDAIWEGKPADVPCRNLSIQGGYIAQEGYWAIRVGADGKLSIVGEIATPDTSFVYSLDEAKSSGIYSGKPVMVDAWLAWQPSLECDTPPYPSDNPCWGGAVTSYLSADPIIEPMGNYGVPSIPVQLGAYNKFGSTDLTTGPIHGVFLIQYTAGYVQVLARLEVAVP